MKATSRATIDDVAKLAGVSIKTVSRVVNREPNVRASTQEKVANAIKSLNYRPNQSARDLASNHSRLIGLIYDDPSLFDIPSSGYIIRLQQGSLRACRAAHYELLIHPCNYRSKDVIGELHSLIEQARPAGMIIAAPLSNMPAIVEAIESTGTPCVRLSPGTLDSEKFSVATNDRDVCAEMTRYLASLGHRKIGFIKGHGKHKAVSLRYSGYKDGLKQSELPFDKDLVAAGDNSVKSGEQCALQLLEREDRPTAIFAANDDMAAGALRVAMRLGIKVPEQLSIAGCDDNSLARQLYPTLTTIRQPLAAMAERAATTLIAQARKISIQAGTDVIAAELRIRESTPPLQTR